MKDTFSTYHPVLNMLYFCGTIGVTMFVVHPVILAISFICAVAYSVVLKGWKKTVQKVCLVGNFFVRTFEPGIQK